MKKITLLILLGFGFFLNINAQTSLLPKSFETVPQQYVNNSIEITVEKQYLNIPIKNKSAKKKVTFIVDGKAEPENDIEIADSEAVWWTNRSCNCSPFLCSLSFRYSRS